MKKITFLCLVSFQIGWAQNYTEYQTGSTTDITTSQQSGVCLMGGASEQEDAMIWFLNRADGGDVVVLRASGSDGYNDYFYSELAADLDEPINSVTTFVINNVNGAIDPFVLQKVADAEAIWFAGGDQYDYVSYFKDNAMEDALNNFINTKRGVIGGTSAGLAILGGSYFSAQNGTVTNAQALSNPYHPRVTLGRNDFLNVPYINNVITDSHYDDPDRRARHSVFLARIATDNVTRSFGIACNEYTAVCVGADGKAYVYGEFPAYDEFAYFLQANCTTAFEPETCTAGTPLTWRRNSEAIKVYKVPGTESGVNYFDLSDWETGSGGEWRDWSIDNGVFTSVVGVNPQCALLSISEVSLAQISVYPNPFVATIKIESETEIESIQLMDVLGKTIPVELQSDMTVNMSSLNAGIYFLRLKRNATTQVLRLLKK
jgi:cyanophycinase-like exopeptidase